MRLTIKRIAKLTKPGRYSDGHGLYLQVLSPTNRSWILRYQRGLNSKGKPKERWLGLGPLHTVPLDTVKTKVDDGKVEVVLGARERARLARQQLLDGIDPIEAKKVARATRALAAAKALTFEQAARQYFDQHEKKWKNRKHAAQFLSTLREYAFPKIGRLSVADIDTGLVLKCLESIWNEKTETASRVRGRIERVLDWATVRGYRTGDNPARWRGHLDNVLPARGQIQKTNHHPALPFDELPEFLTVLRAREGIAARALEFVILTAARTGDIIGNDRDDKPPMRWEHVDLKARIWTVPSTKTETEHRVPLSDPAVALLKEMKAAELSGDVVFGLDVDEPLSNMAMAAVIKRLNEARTARGLPRYVDPKQGNRDVTVHGFRSTFRDWAAERTNYPNFVVEQALAHAIGNKVEAAYRRGDLFAKRVRLMNDWARYCVTKPVTATGGKVVSIRGAR